MILSLFSNINNVPESDRRLVCRGKDAHPRDDETRVGQQSHDLGMFMRHFASFESFRTEFLSSRYAIVCY